MRRRPGIAPLAAILFGVAFLIWTWATLSTELLRPLDDTSLSPAIDVDSELGQIASAVAVLFWPGVLYSALGGIAVWAYQRRLRSLTNAIALAIVSGWVAEWLLKLVFARPRPRSAPPIITSDTFGYPSGHMIAITTAAIIVIATTTTTRQSRPTIMVWRILGALVIVGIGVNRWLLHAHYITDIVAGILVGGLTASLSLTVAGVHMLPEPPVRRPPSGARKRCAVIVNPTKVADWGSFRRHVEFACIERGWEPPLWLETTEGDPGRAMARSAIRRKVDLVLVAGGDGTIRIVCSELASTGIAMGLLPAGTGNLLARNLSIPLDESEALDVAFDGSGRAIDLVRVTVDDAPTSDTFAVMAGMGFDAEIMAATNSDLKKIVGPAAYLLGALQAVNLPPFEATVTIDDAEPMVRLAGIVLVGNVGALQGNVQLMPDAQSDDGLFDVLIASPKNALDWVKVTTSAVTPGPDVEELDRAQGRRALITTATPVAYQLDGDMAGQCSRMEVELLPKVLRVMVP
ncbi:MAG: YegS/Rv2252/BmrU family lipid kinase [Micropruina sp.]|nr:YegS/Rv2252/BmrU family lipid kinase [Micropruina sp.]